MSERQINSYLDAIPDLKTNIQEKTSIMQRTVGILEEITWLTDLDDDCLKGVNDIISLAKDVRSILVRYYVSINNAFRNVAGKEIKAFKNSLDDLKEMYEDLESVFFFLPQMPKFKENTKILSLL